MAKLSVLPLIATIALAGCAAAPATRQAATPPPSPSPAVVAVAANDNLNAVAWSQTAVEHDLVFREIFRSAGDKLLPALKDRKWDALPKPERTGSLKGLKPAVIVDIDETVLDNSPYQARLVQDGGEYSEATWAAWCREKVARPLPGALEFTLFAAKHGITVFYLSNRAQDLNAVTLENLRTDGFPIAREQNVFLGLGTIVEGCEQNGTDKGCRRELIGRTHRVLMQLGDQLGDFVDVTANTAAGRSDAIAPYNGWIGERWFVLPNPTYGSWEPALFGNDWTRTPQQRRMGKLTGLRNN